MNAKCPECGRYHDGWPGTKCSDCAVVPKRSYDREHELRVRSVVDRMLQAQNCGDKPGLARAQREYDRLKGRPVLE